MSEETNVRHADETIAIVPSGQKFMLREKRGSVIIWELDSDVDRDSSDESNVVESSDSLRLIGIL